MDSVISFHATLETDKSEMFSLIHWTGKKPVGRIYKTTKKERE